jgi:fibro-slime domain-containing protein
MRTSTTPICANRVLLAVSLSAFLFGGVFVFGGVGCQSGGQIGPSGGGGSGHGGAGNGGGASSGGGNGGGITIPTVVVGNSALCGNGTLDGVEQCDDGNTKSGDGCNALCQIEANYICPTPGQPCQNQAVCGNGVLTSDETCDDGNTNSGDGCSGDCQTVEPGWVCRVPGKPCSPLCGDGVLTGTETCDDGNTKSGDGCSSTCQLEPGASCPTPGQPCVKSICGNGIVEKGELCDCGTDQTKLPSGCEGVNGLFYGDGKGCSKTCTKEPVCQDTSGNTQACTSACGDGNVDPGEACDDGNQLNGDGCSSTCQVEAGFTCSTQTQPDSSTCQSGSGSCLELPIIYRDFQSENISPGGHPDFPFYGTRFNGSKSPTTVCVPNSGGPAKGNDSTARCWGIAAAKLHNGKPQPGATTTCACQFSDWNIPNGSGGYIPSPGYSEANNDSPLSDGNGGYLGGAVNSVVSTVSTAGAYTGIISGYTPSNPGGPIFKGTVPAYKNAASFNQWFNDDPTVNKTFISVLELKSIGTNIYQYASISHLAQGGFFPLNTLNPSQTIQCMLWPYWNHYNGTSFFPGCVGDQYLFPPRVIQSDCPKQNPLSNGCWVTNATGGVVPVTGQTNDDYFTDEARYYFAYDGTAGISLTFYGDDDLFIFINGVLVLDLGGIHQQLPGKVTVTGNPGDAQVTEGGCLDAAGNITGVTAATGTACSPTNSTPPPPAAKSGDDFLVQTVPLGLVTGKVYEIAIFGADRHPPESNYQLTLNGYTTNRSDCLPRCGDGVVSGGEQCDCGDGTVPVPAGCPGPNNDATYGGCNTQCQYGPFCGDGITQKTNGGNEECDQGKLNGSAKPGDPNGCTLGCLLQHYCGDGIVDSGPPLNEQCDLGANNGQPNQPCDSGCQFIIH